MFVHSSIPWYLWELVKAFILTCSSFPNIFLSRLLCLFLVLGVVPFPKLLQLMPVPFLMLLPSKICPSTGNSELGKTKGMGSDFSRNAIEVRTQVVEKKVHIAACGTSSLPQRCSLWFAQLLPVWYVCVLGGWVVGGWFKITLHSITAKQPPFSSNLSLVIVSFRFCIQEFFKGWLWQFLLGH